MLSFGAEMGPNINFRAKLGPNINFGAELGPNTNFGAKWAQKVKNNLGPSRPHQGLICPEEFFLPERKKKLCPNRP